MLSSTKRTIESTTNAKLLSTPTVYSTPGTWYCIPRTISSMEAQVPKGNRKISTFFVISHGDGHPFHFPLTSHSNLDFVVFCSDQHYFVLKQRTMSSTSSSNNDNSISQTDRVLQLLQENPLSDALEYYAYGTAGFRYKADWMEGLFVRVGIVSAFLLNNNDDDTNNNSHVDGGNMGLMVTASHNDESYNGIKVSNPDGSMMTPDQERLMVEWVNQKDLQPWKIRLESYFDDKRKNKNAKEVVLHVGRDTRSHSQSLTDLAIRGAKAMGITVIDHGILTTPMLHHIVLYSNLSKDGDDEAVATRASYIQHYAQAYCDLIHSMRKKQKDQPALRSSSSSLRVDCACGVGFKAVQEVVQAIQSRDGGGAFGSRMIHPWNAPGQGPLNVQCGSEHVQKQLQSPNWYSSNTSTLDNDDDTSYCCALDGDADRIVFFAKSNENDDLLLLDGDKIAVLIAHVLQPLVRTLDANLTMGVVQTAYANGASTKYLKVCVCVCLTIRYLCTRILFRFLL